MSRFVKNKQQLVSECRRTEESSSHLVKQSFPSIRKLSLNKQRLCLALLCPRWWPRCTAGISDSSAVTHPAWQRWQAQRTQVMSQWFIQAPVRTSVAHQMFLKENNGTQVLFGDPLRKYTNVTLILPRDPPSQSLHLSSFVCSTHE